MPSASNGPATSVDVDGEAVRLTSPDKPVFPGVSKREVFEYYLAVGDVMVEQIGGRPTALERWPDGVGEGVDHFFQKHLPKSVPPYVHGIAVRFPSGRPGTLLDPATRAAILWAVQMGAITFHAWPVTAPDVAHPDQLRLDLDPSPANDFADVRRVAASCREVLDELGLPSFVKTSGSRGLHVFVPSCRRTASSTSAMRPSRSAASSSDAIPTGVTVSWWKEERGDRVFLDFNQNAQDRLMASAYSLRPRPSAPVSMPFAWDDLDDVDPDAFTLRTVPAIVSSRATDPWGGMRDAAADLAPALAWWDRDVADGLPGAALPAGLPEDAGRAAAGAAEPREAGLALEQVLDAGRGRHLELVVAAGGGASVGPPADEPHAVPEPVALHLVVRDLGDQLGPERDPRLFLLPPVGRSGDPDACVSAPRVRLVLRTGERREQVDEIAPDLRGEGRGAAHVLQATVGIVQAEQQAAHDRLAIRAWPSCRPASRPRRRRRCAGA